MTKDQIDAIIALGGVLIAATAGTVTSVFAVKEFFKFQTTRVVEKSVGETKIRELEKAHAKVLDDIEQLRSADKMHQKHLEKLDEDYQEMIRRVFDFFRGGRKER